MVILNLSTGATTSGTALTFSSTSKTNNKLIVNGSTVQVPVPGVYEIVGNATFTNATASTYGVSIYANGTAINSNAQASIDANGVATVPIYSTVEIVNSPTSSDYATISFMPIGAPNITGGTISIKQIM